MQIAGGLVAEFECDSNAVACPRLYPGRVRERGRVGPGPRRRIGDGAARGKKIFKSMARRLELESTFRVGHVSTHRESLRGRRQRGGKKEGARGSREDGEKIFKFRPSARRHEPDARRPGDASLSNGVWANDLFTARSECASYSH